MRSTTISRRQVDLIDFIHESNRQLEVARDKVIDAVGAAKLAASDCG
jgi:hypothetical protein